MSVLSHSALRMRDVRAATGQLRLKPSIVAEELAMVVTVQVQMLVPEFTVINLVPYLLTIPLCGQFKVQWSELEY